MINRIIALILVLIVCGSVPASAQLAESSLGRILPDRIEAGYVGSQSLTVTATTAVQIGTLTTGTKVVEIWTNAALNYGASGVTAGQTTAYIATETVKAFEVATTTPAIYLRSRNGDATVHILHRR